MRRPPLAACGRRSLLFSIILGCLTAWVPPTARALPLCTNGRAPVRLKKTLTFCSAYGRGSGGSSCCDAAPRKRFNTMNVSDAACAGVVKSILCAVITDDDQL